MSLWPALPVCYRFQHSVPSSNIAPGSDDVKTWCQDVQALKAFVWIEWLIFSLTAYITLRYTISQKNRGNNHILRMPLSRYSPHLRNDGTTEYIRNSEFLQFSEPKL
ncbi:hypothetical protein HHX47_DHR10000164 [Lentinula edodes]|nr:hypothetical protein HHX47_DHR10000164 [Lentinula edodes]